MKSNKKRLLCGLTIGTIGLVLYNSIKYHEEKLKYIERDTSNDPINTDKSPESSRKDNELIDFFNDLKKQASLLEDRLNELKK
ncbi:hypothetical protein [Clostridium sp.]|uniref:hypothetical protein n=1 Tax=Clostridium sp. TaxID=1506 RepID=UPI002847A1BD|nr:hypothetical protein [Clostridium sp.]MDR3597418.1 hypothetical protein [Clostridium sp.]